jgi:N-acetylmuramoyl-L-alanine amidase
VGAVWLHNLPGILGNAGLDYGLWPGWETRARSSGGYERILGVGLHHDAGAEGSSLDSRCRYAWENSPDRPIGAMWLHDDGFIMIGAAGATNTQGKGGPRQCSKGTIPLDAGNKYTISVEASNNGVGEPWTAVQQDVYVRLCAALCDEFDLTAGDCFAHFEWTSRKIDPAGQSKYASGGDKWNMDSFRSDVFWSNPNPEPIPPTPIPIPGDDDDVTTKLLYCDLNHNAPYGTWYLCGDDHKTWISDGNALAQFGYRIAEAKGIPVDYSKPAPPIPPTQPLTGVCPLDGFRYAVLTNANPDLIASYGPIIGPRPPGVDEYGR